MHLEIHNNKKANAVAAKEEKRKLSVKSDGTSNVDWNKI